MTIIKADVLVVGAGLAGLAAAGQLQQQGLKVLLVDKGRSVGGRMATRRIGAGQADYGAQFFTVRTWMLQKRVDDWLERGLVYKWSMGWADGSLLNAPADGHPRYAVRDGMNALARHLARGLDVRLAVGIANVLPEGAGWQARDEAGQRYQSRALLLTPPVPQSLSLLENGQVDLDPADRSALARIDYAPCMAGLFLVDGVVRLPEPGAVQRPDHELSWIADNQRKGISPQARVITVHAGETYSRQLWDQPETAALTALQEGLQPFLDPKTEIRAAHLKRWRYAMPIVLHPERCLRAAGLPPLVFAGDAFGGPRVEGAILSGLAAADLIGPRLTAA